MASTTIPEAVFLDVQTFEHASFNFQTQPFKALRRHLQSGRLRLIISDITVAEVKARIAKNVVKEVASHTNFVKSARVLRHSPVSVNAVGELNPAEITASLHTAFADFLKDNKAEVIDTSKQEAGSVFEKYFAGKPPFGTGDKKYEFPDAFVIQSLIEWTECKQEELFVVSADELFLDAFQECNQIHAKHALSEVLDHVASDDEKLAEFIRSEVVERVQTIANDAKKQFEDLGFDLEDEWGDVEVEVTDIELDGDPEILEVGLKEATLRMSFDAEFDAHLSFDDSSTGIWDSEEGQMLFMEHRNVTVRETDELLVEARVVFDGLDPTKFKIDRVDLIEPLSGYGISARQHDWD